MLCDQAFVSRVIDTDSLSFHSSVISSPDADIHQDHRLANINAAFLSEARRYPNPAKRFARNFQTVLTLVRRNAICYG